MDAQQIVLPYFSLLKTRHKAWDAFLCDICDMAHAKYFDIFFFYTGITSIVRSNLLCCYNITNAKIMTHFGIGKPNGKWFKIFITNILLKIRQITQNSVWQKTFNLDNFIILSQQFGGSFFPNQIWWIRRGAVPGLQ